MWRIYQERQPGTSSHLQGLLQLGGEAGDRLLHALKLVPLPLQKGGLGLHLLHDLVQVLVHPLVLDSLRLQQILRLHVGAVQLNRGAESVLRHQACNCLRPQTYDQKESGINDDPISYLC